VGGGAKVVLDFFLWRVKDDEWRVGKAAPHRKDS
jgi:hypothetical protein